MQYVIDIAWDRVFCEIYIQAQARGRVAMYIALNTSYITTTPYLPCNNKPEGTVWLLLHGYNLDNGICLRYMLNQWKLRTFIPWKYTRYTVYSTNEHTLVAACRGVSSGESWLCLWSTSFPGEGVRTRRCVRTSSEMGGAEGAEVAVGDTGSLWFSHTIWREGEMDRSCMFVMRNLRIQLKKNYTDDGDRFTASAR